MKSQHPVARLVLVLGVIALFSLSLMDVRLKANASLKKWNLAERCLLYTSPSPRDRQKSRMPSSA